ATKAHAWAGPNPATDHASAAQSMTAASISWRRAKSAALNAPCVARPSRIGTQLGCLDIGSLPVQLGMPNFPESDFLLALHRAQFCQESGPILGEPASGKGPTHVVRNRRASGQIRKVKVPLTNLPCNCC